jgi:hypothetical protein
MSTKPKIYIRRQGSVNTIFVDPSTGAPLPFYEWGNEPVGGFPSIPTAAEMAHFLQLYDPVYIEPPTKQQREELSTQKEELEAARMLKEAPSTPKAAATPAPAPVASRTPTVDVGPFTRENLLLAFKHLDDADVEAVGSFLLSLDPGIEAELMAARLPRAKRRFTLNVAE